MIRGNGKSGVWSWLLFGFLLFPAVCLAADSETGLVGYWKFDEGQGNMCKDSSGHGNQGILHGNPTWERGNYILDVFGNPLSETGGSGCALKLDGVDDYVDCGNGPSLDITGPLTLEAWINPLEKPTGEPGVVGKDFNSYALTYYRPSHCYWYISSGDNNCATPIGAGAWSHVAGVFDGTMVRLYLNGRPVRSRKSGFNSVGKGKNLLIGCIVSDPAAQDPGDPRVPHFKGLIDEVRVYNRALTEKEIVRRYNLHAEEKGKNLLDVAWFDKLKVTPCYYGDRDEIVVALDYRGLLPLSRESRIVLLLRKRQTVKVQKRREMKSLSTTGIGEVRFSLKDLAAGDYEVGAVFGDEKGIRVAETVGFTHPAPPVSVVSPEEKTVPPLPPALEPTPYRFELSNGGGFTIGLKGTVYPFESSFSYPYGGENRLDASPRPNAAGEKAWKVEAERLGRGEFRVSAQGSFYSVERNILVQRTRVYVKDTITNKSEGDIGIIIRNHLNGKQKRFTDSYLAGWKEKGRRDGSWSPSVFIGGKGVGLGLVPLDDVYILQATLYCEKGCAGIETHEFGLAKGVSYTLDWAVYPNGTGDYYDFINAVRRDEGRIGTIDGGLAFISKGPRDRSGIPSEEFLKLRNPKYGVIHCLSFAADDPGISIEGIEFMDFPEEIAALKKQIAAIHEKYRDLKVSFHVAHQLYATNRPDETYPDSKVIDKEGKHVVYAGESYYTSPAHKYFSRERINEGWRWWRYYPTPGNSFHDALLRSVDVMMDEIGCDGAFMDGFVYDDYTYDRWDGHTVEIDPETKTIKRKMGNLGLLSQPSLVALSRRIGRKGGVVIANGCRQTRTITQEDNIMYDVECRSGPFLHLAPNIAALNDPGKTASERDFYTNVLDNLKWGNATFYYEGYNVSYESLPAQMFPITFEEIRSGLIKGPERIVTMNSGVYGWPKDASLHVVYCYDVRGARSARKFLTTADRSGVRTELDLKERESAVIKKIPVSVRARRGVNLVTQQYDDEAIRMLVNGRGGISITVKDGEFAVKADAPYLVKTHEARTIRADREGLLSFDIALNGQLEVRIEPVP